MLHFRFSSPSELISVLYYLCSFDDGLRFEYTILVNTSSSAPSGSLTHSAHLKISTTAIPPFCYTVVELENTSMGLPTSSSSSSSSASFSQNGIGGGGSSSPAAAAFSSSSIPLPELSWVHSREGVTAVGPLGSDHVTSAGDHQSDQPRSTQEGKRWSTSWVVSGSHLIAALRALHDGQPFMLLAPIGNAPLRLVQQEHGKYTHWYQLHTLYDLGPRLELDHGTLYFYPIQDVDGFRQVLRSLSTCPLEFADISLRWDEHYPQDHDGGFSSSNHHGDRSAEGEMQKHTRLRFEEQTAEGHPCATAAAAEGRDMSDSSTRGVVPPPKAKRKEEGGALSPRASYEETSTHNEAPHPRSASGAVAADAPSLYRVSSSCSTAAHSSSPRRCALRIASESVTSTLQLGKVSVPTSAVMGSLRCGDAVTFGSLLTAIHQKDRFCRLSVGFGEEGLAALELQWSSLIGEHSAKLYFCAGEDND